MHEFIKIKDNWIEKIVLIQIKDLKKFTIKIKLKKANIQAYEQAISFIKILILNLKVIIAKSILTSSG
jgi:hypothetical protein